MTRFRSELAALACAAFVLGGCADVEVPSDHVTVIVNGQQTSIAQSGSVSVEIDGAPELDYSGPAGCEGRYFADGESGIYFRYTPRRAHLLRGDRLYTFAEPPRQSAELIVWSHTFGPDKVTVLANCPLPTR
jgi:hypothetical protein